MKPLIRIAACVAVLIFICETVSAYTFDWKGTSSTAWNNSANWTKSGSGGTSTWPGQSGSVDIVRIGVTNFTSNQPTLSSASINVASIEFGDNNDNDMTLTVNGVTLTVTGTIKQDFVAGYFVFIFPVSENLTTTLTGTGTISCQNLTIGDGTQPTLFTNNVTQVSSQINQLTITNNVTLAAEGDNNNILGPYSDVNFPAFSVDKNKVTIKGQIVTSIAANPGNTTVAGFSGAGLFITDTGSGNTTVELANASPISTPIANQSSIDFTGGGSGTGIVMYDATSGTQTVYTGATSGLGTGNNYDYLALSGASSKTVLGSALTLTNDLTTTGGTVNFSTNNPTVTIGGNWTNTTTINDGSGTITCNGNFANNAGGTLNCSSGAVYFNGNYTNAATFTASTGTVYFNKAGAQTLTDNTAGGTIFNNVTFENSGTKSLTGTGGYYVTSTNVLTMGGTAALSAGGLLTLKSDASGSATVAAIPALASITGNVNVQRYLTGGAIKYRGYRLMSSPVYNGADGFLNNVYSINYLKTSIYLTATTTTGGFDNTSAANPSLYLYRENLTSPSNAAFTASNYRGINAINNTPSYKYTLDVDGAGFYIPSGNGFLCWFRGNRASATYAAETVTSYVPQTVTLSTSGTLNQQSVIVHSWFTPSLSTLSYTLLSPVKGYTLVGNPYASSIDWENFQALVPASGIYGLAVGNTIYVIDPVSHNYGAYTKGGGGVGTNHASNIISSGQGFFITTSSALAQLIFNESAKTNTLATGTNLLMGKPADQSANLQYLRLQLAKDSINTDDMLIRFNSTAKTTFDAAVDAPYKAGYGAVSLSSKSSDNVDLAINMRPFPAANEHIPLNVNMNTDGIYALNMENITGIPQLYDIWLIDAYKKDSLDMRHYNTYNFNVYKNDSASYGSKRFSLVIRQNQALAYHLLSFSAVKANISASARRVQISWTAENEQNYTNFTVQRSTDAGKTWDVTGSTSADGTGNYGIYDNDPGANNLYRLQSQDIDGTLTYSNIVPIGYSGQSSNLTINTVSVYPNPALSNITINIINPAGQSGSYNVVISNSSGLVVKQTTSAQLSWQTNVSNLVPGTYVVRVFSAKDQSELGNTKFIKL